jgi:hypothetical protein
VLLASALAGCGTMTEQNAAMAFAAPGKFNVYTCQDLATRARELHRRQAELEQVMGRAQQSAGGALINTVAYRTEYLQTRGELEELNKSANDKQCSTESKWSSGRTLY